MLCRSIVAGGLALAALIGAAMPALVQGGTTEPPSAPFVEFLNLLLQSAVTALAPVLVAFAINLLRQAAAKVRASVSADQWLLLQAMAATVVQAAEQSGLAGHIESEGRAKKAWALAELQRLAAERGLAGLDVTTLANLIEAEVFRQFNQPPQPVPLVSVPSTGEG